MTMPACAGILLSRVQEVFAVLPVVLEGHMNGKQLIAQLLQGVDGKQAALLRYVALADLYVCERIALMTRERPVGMRDEVPQIGHLECLAVKPAYAATLQNGSRISAPCLSCEAVSLSASSSASRPGQCFPP